MPTQSSFKIIVEGFFVKIMSGMGSGSFLALTFFSFLLMCVSRILLYLYSGFRTLNVGQVQVLLLLGLICLHRF